jgi:predicted NodU family carbamoyl transferase
MNILGISGQERDAAAALIQDGKVVAAIEEAKLARIRHVGMNYAGGLPYRAIEFCLDRARITFDDLDYVAYYLEPHKLFHREIAFNSSLAIDAPDPSFIEEFPSYFVDSLNGLKQRLRTRQLIESRLSGRGQFVVVAHHLAHGASAFYGSSFARAAVIALDNRGDMTSAALMTGDGGRVTLQAEAQFPNSVGLVYSAVTAALGFSFSGDWHKTMWLSPTGQPVYMDLFADLLGVDARGLPVVNLEYFDTSSLNELLCRAARRTSRSVKSTATWRRACRPAWKTCCASSLLATARRRVKRSSVLPAGSRSTASRIPQSKGARGSNGYSFNQPPATRAARSARRFTSGTRCSATTSEPIGWSTPFSGRSAARRRSRAC